MKKLITAIVIVLVLFASFLVAYNKIPAFKSFIDKIIDSMLTKELEPYSDEFEINKLKVKNQSFYYNTLTDQQKCIYTAIANGVKNYERSFTLQNYIVIDNETSMKDIETTMKAFFADHPEVFYVDNKYTISTKKTIFKTYIDLEITYSSRSETEIKKEIDELDEKINGYLKNVETKNGVEAEIALHDAIGTDVVYYTYKALNNIPLSPHTIYGVFIDKEAVCDGFAKAMQILLDRKNIENILVLGNIDDESHAWNLVKLDNDWYHLDLTSNKSIKNVDPKLILHTYFNVTKGDIAKTHDFENESILPNADNDKYNYYVYTGKYISTFDNFNTKLKKLIENNENSNLLEFGTDGISSVPEKMVTFLSQNKYNEYVSNNKITYYTILDTYILMKNK